MDKFEEVEPYKTKRYINRIIKTVTWDICKRENKKKSVIQTEEAELYLTADDVSLEKIIMKREISRLLKEKLILTMVPLDSFAGECSYVDVIKANFTDEENQLCWTGTESVDCDLVVLGGQANVWIEVCPCPNKGDEVKFTVNLQQYKSGKWTNLKQWSASENANYGVAEFGESYSVERGYQYRFTATIKVYNGSTLQDTINVTSQSKSY